MGFDMLAAEVDLALQSELSGLQVIAVVPYRGQAERWKDAMKARYDTIPVSYTHLLAWCPTKKWRGHTQTSHVSVCTYTDAVAM